MSCKALFIFSESSSQVAADVHSDLSFKIIIISAASVGIGSVGISPLPIFPITFCTSGNLFFRICAACIHAFDVVLILLLCSTLVSTAKSPSGNSGINSPPNFVKTNMAITNSETEIPITVFWNFNTLCNHR